MRPDAVGFRQRVGGDNGFARHGEEGDSAVRLDDVGKGGLHLAKQEPADGDGDETERPRIAQREQVDRLVPEQRVAGLGDRVQKRVPLNHGPDRGRDGLGVGAKEDRAGIQGDDREEIGQLHDIAKKHAQGTQSPRESDRQQHVRNENQREPHQSVEGERVTDEQATQDEQSEADKEVEPVGPDIGERKDVEREDHLFHEVGLADNKRRRGRQGLGEDMEQDEPEEHCHRVVERRFLDIGVERPAEDDAEHGDVEPEHQQRVEHGPNDAQVAATVTLLDRTHRKLPEQVQVTGKRDRRRSRGGTIRRHEECC